MVLEATLICMDNSEWTRNGDFAPTRFEAQQDAANLICGVKTNHHIENCVGILTMAGERVDVRVTPTNDLGQVLSGLHGVRIRGNSDFIRGIQTAQLALKHRMNKNQKQRIICFAASPVAAESKQLEILGKQLKKNNVALDIISFGEVGLNSGKLKDLHEAVNSNNTSHFLECPAGAGQLLSDMILNSPIVRDADRPDDGGVEGAAGAATGGAAGGVNEFGVDPNIDPDLYMALRISLEEEQARTQRTADAGSAAATSSVSAAASSSAAQTSSSQTTPEQAGTLLAETATSATAGSTSNAGVTTSDAEDVQMAANDTEMDDELREALLLSMRDYGGTAVSNATAGATTSSEAGQSAATSNTSSTGQGAVSASTSSFADPAFVQQMLGNLPGVNLTDERLQSALRAAAETEQKRSSDDDEQKKREEGEKK